MSTADFLITVSVVGTVAGVCIAIVWATWMGYPRRTGDAQLHEVIVEKRVRARSRRRAAKKKKR